MQQHLSAVSLNIDTGQLGAPTEKWATTVKTVDSTKADTTVKKDSTVKK